MNTTAPAIDSAPEERRVLRMPASGVSTVERRAPIPPEIRRILVSGLGAALADAWRRTQKSPVAAVTAAGRDSNPRKDADRHAESYDQHAG